MNIDRLDVQIARPFGGSDHQGFTAIHRHVHVSHTHGIPDQRRGVIIFESDRVAHHCLRVARAVRSIIDCHQCERILIVMPTSPPTSAYYLGIHAVQFHVEQTPWDLARAAPVAASELLTVLTYAGGRLVHH